MVLTALAAINPERSVPKWVSDVLERTGTVHMNIPSHNILVGLPCDMCASLEAVNMDPFTINELADECEINYPPDVTVLEGLWKYELVCYYARFTFYPWSSNNTEVIIRHEIDNTRYATYDYVDQKSDGVYT